MSTSFVARFTLGVFSLVMFCATARGDLVLSADGFENAEVLDFTGNYRLISDGVQVGSTVGEDIFLSNDGELGKLGDLNTTYHIGNNGKWTSATEGVVTIGERTGQSAATIRFDFRDGPVSAVGSWMNYAPNNGPFSLSVHLTGGAQETYVLTERVEWGISTSGNDKSAFRGIVRNANDIEAFTVTGAYGALAGLQFYRGGIQAVPEPSTLALVGVAAGAAGAWRLSRRRASGKPQPPSNT